MTNTPSFISGSEVVCAGSFVFHTEDYVEILPFSNDPSFKVRFKPNMRSQLSSGTIGLSYDGDKTAVFTISRKFVNNTTISTSAPIEFAEEDDRLSDYFMSLALTTFGTEDHHTAVLNYTVLKKLRSQGGQ